MAAPVVTNATPSPGSTVAPTDVLGFDVTDADSGFRRIIAIARYPNKGLWEVMHDGGSFAPFFVTSTRSNITDGFRYRCARTGGWPDSQVLFVVFAIDVDGDEAS
jgi:hypothetical protein